MIIQKKCDWIMQKINFGIILAHNEKFYYISWNYTKTIIEFK